MVALVILGLGLLFIAAALPVGLEYTRRTVDLANADAAAEYALEQLEMNLRTSVRLYDEEIQDYNNSVYHRLDNIHRPREQTVSFPVRWALRPTYEPVIKVRPLALGNIGLYRVLASDPLRGAELVDYGELAISTYLNNVWNLSLDAVLLRCEYEFPYDGSGATYDLLSLVRNPVLSGIARVYPPVEPVTTFTVGGFFDTDDNTYPTTYAMRGGSDNPLLAEDAQFRERQKAIERRIGWTAFYRRISYRGDAGPDTAWFSDDDVADEPLRYELVVVVTQRPTVNHRFPQQDVTIGNAFEEPQAISRVTTTALVGTDRLVPTPWLVTFDSNADDPLPELEYGVDYGRVDPDTENEERVLSETFSDPPTLEFKCTPEVGELLPAGSIVIPAVNDQRYVPPTAGLPQYVGFVPSARQSLPIYEVVEVIEPDDSGESWTIVVKNNGYYPWLNPGVGALNAAYFPFWIIPPAFVERDSDGQPVYERSSPVLKVVRRTVTLHEIHR